VRSRDIKRRQGIKSRPVKNRQKFKSIPLLVKNVLQKSPLARLGAGLAAIKVYTFRAGRSGGRSRGSGEGFAGGDPRESRTPFAKGRSRGVVAGLLGRHSRGGRYLFASSRRNVFGIRELFLRVCVVAALLLVAAVGWRVIRPGVTLRVSADTVAAFRVPHRAIGMLRGYADSHGIPFPELFAVFNAENDFFPEKSASYDLSRLEDMYVTNFRQIFRRYSRRSIAPYAEMFENLFDEIEVFPIPTGWYEHDASVMFGNSWGVEHNFQGNRTHMGTAIIDRENIRGRVPVVSMTAGSVSDAGWCSQLGYFVGVTSRNGTYYLYAHLDSIATGLLVGQNVAAGQLLGLMGNTGGGRGSSNFQVHLHLAIAPDVRFTRGQFWINPYPLLRYIEDRRDV